MVTQRQAQTGNRVYRGTGQAPNRGQVSAQGAQGYIKRELNRNQGGVVQPVGRDGKSDSRSGVASRALQNNLGNNTVRPPASSLNAPRGGKNMQGSKIPPNKQGSNPVGDPVAQAPVVPQIKVNDQGLLELPYSQNLSMTALQALEESNQGLLDLQTEEQTMAQEAAQMRRDADNTYGQLKTQTLGNNASSGTAFSSQYAKGVADNATAYSNTLADIQRQESDFSQQASAKRASIQSSLAQQLAAAAQGEADTLNESAGSLGYGRSTTRPHSHKDRDKKHGSKGGPVKGKGKK